MAKLFPALRPNSLNLLLAPILLEKERVNLLLCKLALKGPVCVLDGGNRFDVHGLARWLRRLTNQVDSSLSRVQIQRAFTCRQVHTLLAEQPNSPVPLFILEPLVTFCDENVPAAERLHLLENCINEMERLARHAMLVVIVSKTRADPEYLARLRRAADYCYEFEEPKKPLDWRLF